MDLSGLERGLSVSPTEGAPGRFGASFPEGYRQGRGVYGGMVLGALARAAIASEPDPERRVRAFLGAIVAPVPDGDVDVTASVVRRGSAVTTVDVGMSRGEGALARATVVLGRARGHDGRFALEPPAIPDVTSLASLTLGPPFAPEFLQHFELWSTGPSPFSGSEPRTEGFVRSRAPLASLDAAEIIALVDCFWPALFSREAGPRPMATVTFDAQVFYPEGPVDPGAPLYFRARVLAAADGYFAEARELWTPGGELVALNQQTFAVI